MLTYNTQKRRLRLPEYGRNIQQMIDHCLTIEDREERTRCAHTIVAAMATLFPTMKETAAGLHKLWDHLDIMSDYRLDVDRPFERMERPAEENGPLRVPYPSGRFRFRHYGRVLEQMITRAASMEPSEERDVLVERIANQMKKLLLTVNANDDRPDRRVFKELAEMSHGELRLDPENYRLQDFKIVAPPQPSKKKRRK